MDLLSSRSIVQEICYIPTWPWGYITDGHEHPKADLTPRCVETVAPYSFLRGRLSWGPGRHSTGAMR